VKDVENSIVNRTSMKENDASVYQH